MTPEERFSIAYGSDFDWYGSSEPGAGSGEDFGGTSVLTVGHGGNCEIRDGALGPGAGRNLHSTFGLRTLDFKGRGVFFLLLAGMNASTRTMTTLVNFSTFEKTHTAERLALQLRRRFCFTLMLLKPENAILS